MKATIERWDDRAVVPIPAAVMEAAQLSLGQEIEIRAETGTIVIAPAVIAPARLVSHDLASLLAGITEDNLHGEVSTGSAVGREVW